MTKFAPVKKIDLVHLMATREGASSTAVYKKLDLLVDLRLVNEIDAHHVALTALGDTWGALRELGRVANEQ